LSAIYDDNVNAGSAAGKDDSMALNPYVGVSFITVTPQTTIDLYARLGLIYYFDAPQGLDDVYGQSRLGLNVVHRFSERLRFASQNFVSYELEPDYSYGYASSRTTGEYFFWQSDNSIGFRWTERLATYTGLRLNGVNYADVSNNDRFTWELYNQFRYQLSAQTVLTLDYRYGQTDGDGLANDSQNQYLLVGAEHRFSPNIIGIVRAGAQFRDVDNGDETTSPYLEFALNSQLTQSFRLRSYARYGIEDYDTVQFLPGGLVEYSDRRTLRFGISGEYVFNPMVSMFGGVDYIPTSYQSGNFLPAGPSAPDVDEDILNAYIGVSYRFNDFLTATASYNYTNSSSDFASRDYDRNRISIGVSAEF
ncbi:MAG TPA: outer membrane beta-barrel protein, partial [Luteolibacter sp.]|nr:outer membrane beta-barrel protein [Luteolibacter sp.]